MRNLLYCTNNCKLIYLFIFSIFINTSILAQQIIPAAAETTQKVDININNIANIYTKDKILSNEIKLFNDYLKKISFPVLLNKESKQNCLYLEYDKSMKEEEYRIDFLENNSLKITGKNTGVFYGLMTLLQCYNSKQKIISKTMHDYPAFEWRGMHLDVSRHFFPVDFIKKYIDFLALHKFNTFHWHLTDDQGWRIEIKKYPLLTSIGSKRRESILEKNFTPYIGDGIPVEGFYTQENIKDIVAYAAERHINVVPEIEMPGHAMAALAAYPEYSCKDTALDVMTIWGVSEDVFCTKENTYTFLKNILDEVMILFPSKYIHIGGDEVPKTRWKTCNNCQQVMKKNNLKNEHELQSYFIKKIDAYVTSKGRNIIGWDEILEGGLAPNAAVMSWRGEDGGIEASKQKHKVVMSPGTHCYFDHYQGNSNTEPLAIGGYTPIEKVYNYNPIPDKLNLEQSTYILGAQANVWTEYISTPEQVEYMIAPRMCALSEVLWTGKAKPGFDDFKNRLRTHFSFLDKFNVYYARSIFDIEATSVIGKEQLNITLKSNYQEGNIYYTTDGTSPDANSLKYYSDSSIKLFQSALIKAQYFENGDPMGHEFSKEYYIHKGIGKNIQSNIAPSKYYNFGGLPKLLDGIEGKKPRVNNEWLAWQEDSTEIVIDLGEEQLLNEVSISLLNDNAAYIYLPTQIDVFVGTTLENFILAKSMVKIEIESAYNENTALDIPFDNMILGRFIHVKFKNLGKIPEGKIGAGEKSWLFLSEIEID